MLSTITFNFLRMHRLQHYIPTHQDGISCESSTLHSWSPIGAESKPPAYSLWEDHNNYNSVITACSKCRVCKQGRYILTNNKYKFFAGTRSLINLKVRYLVGRNWESGPWLIRNWKVRILMEKLEVRAPVN